MTSVRLALLGLFIASIAAATRAAADGESRAALQRNLAAWHRLSPDSQNRMRLLDRSLNEEDPATRQRLLSVAQRYANWLNRLSDEDRSKIFATPADSERIRAIRDALDRQWLDGLPKSFRDELAAKPQERTTLIAKWKNDDRDRRNERADALRDIDLAVVPGLPFADKSFREDVGRFVRETLEPKLNEREKRRLANASRLNYYVQVAALSQAHGLKPPGPPEAWKKLADRKPRIGPPL